MQNELLPCGMMLLYLMDVIGYVTLKMGLFCRENYRRLVPYLVMHDGLEQVHTLASTIGREARSVMQECFPDVVVYVLPLFATESAQQSDKNPDAKQRLEQAIICYHKFEEEISKTVWVASHICFSIKTCDFFLQRLVVKGMPLPVHVC